MTLCSMLKRTEVKGNLLPARWVTDTATISVWKKRMRMRWGLQVFKALVVASAEFSLNTELI